MTEPEIETPTPSLQARLSQALTPRGIAKIVATSSTKFIVTSAIASLVPTETRTEKVKVVVGSYVIAGVMTEKIHEQVDEKIDEMLMYVSLVKQAMKDLEVVKPDSDNVHNITTL